MNIQVIQPGRLEIKEMASLSEALVKKLYPEFQPIRLPGWLASKTEEGIWIYECSQKILIVFFWREAPELLENLTRLTKIQSSWSNFVSGFDAQNHIATAIFAKEIPSSILKLFSQDSSVRLFELTLQDEEQTLFVKEKTENHSSPEKKKIKSEIAPPKSAGPEGAVRQEAAFSSFFYKMGKLSEEELTRFVELEADLAQTQF
ncbi:MAG: hypothetical protein HY586_07715 [Candidatus Omnitrophica bacterium]|nr:hypothetical protein [Candidatus Omnitrophota bacterium]